jgi:hypothetical protein
MADVAAAQPSVALEARGVALPDAVSLARDEDGRLALRMDGALGPYHVQWSPGEGLTCSGPGRPDEPEPDRPE